MNKIIFKIVKNSINVDIYNKDIKEDLNNTNVINTKEIYFSTDYIKTNLELVSSFLNVIVIKQNVNKVTIKNYDIIPTVLDIINNIPSINELIIKPDKAITYDIFLKLLDNKYLTYLNVYDIPNYLLERLDINKKLNIELRIEILFVSNFMNSNNLNTYSEIYYKKNIIIDKDFNDNDKNDYLTFLNINKYLKQIEFTYFDKNIFIYIMDNLINLNKQNIKIIFNEEYINVLDIISAVNEYKNKNQSILEENNITFKINYSDEYKKNNMFKQINLNFVKVSLLAIILVVTFMMGINIYHNYIDNKNSDEISKDLNILLKNKTTSKTIESNDSIEFIEPNDSDYNIINETTTTIYDIQYKMIFDELLSINKDTVGWIKVNNTNIDYPVVKATDNDFYLKHDYYRNTNRHGWIFMDYRNGIDENDKNTIIYGHNLANQKMFGTLRYVLNQSWYTKTNNQIITFNTLNNNEKYQIFSIYKIPVTTDYLATNFNSDDDFMKFIDLIKSRSIYDFNIEITKDDRIITLSTCSNGSDQRLVVHAVAIKKDE